ncbi:hypothetical protein SADUNF_Sadunf17G0042100 [Salix dunnii]|uniref:Uncharacterized protein n=1 Tax=Salix dunnii TaxID=1413687 RepID=A0A835MH20_9ROSI|nr:hypothetical protein SADUNF_Sadunf17G0042100 [Salix dunnii]
MKYREIGSDNAQTNEIHQKQTAHTIPHTSSQRPKDTYFLTESIVIHLQTNNSMVYFPGGGERKGIKGIVVGIGMDGIVVGIGMAGIEGMLGSGGKVTLGRLGIVGRLGSGGSEGLGREGCVVGNVGCCSVGIEGIGGSVGLGRLGTEGKGGNCRS